MALIKCPECQKKISDKAEVCIHCGYPISSMQKQQDSIADDSSKYCVVFRRLGTANKLEVIKTIRLLTNSGLAETVKMVDNAPSVIAKNVTLTTAKDIQKELDKLYVVSEIEKSPNSDNDNHEEQQIRQMIDKYKDDTVRCPRCGSAAITTGQRGYSLFSGFIGSNKTINRCGQCGYSWEPHK